MLDALGHPEWTAYSEDEYIGKAVALARNTGLRQRLRFAQREKMMASALCNAGDLARQLEDAYSGMYTRACAR
jgi:predicted O-linked N-acetylglucosamine transferase (SPINDLY family)